MELEILLQGKSLSLSRIAIKKCRTAKILTGGGRNDACIVRLLWSCLSLPASAHFWPSLLITSTHWLLVLGASLLSVFAELTPQQAGWSAKVLGEIKPLFLYFCLYRFYWRWVWRSSPRPHSKPSNCCSLARVDWFLTASIDGAERSPGESGLGTGLPWCPGLSKSMID